MVYRGKPSKACQRCRERRLRCDLQKPECGACIRAKSQCTGYRNFEGLRIQDETQVVRSKTVVATNDISANQRLELPAALILAHLPLGLQTQARQLFFTFYISDFSRDWDFLFPYFGATNAPEHVALGVDAVSLAFFSHHVPSPSAKNLARSKYISALRQVNVALQSAQTAKEATTLETCLLLDLVEKIMDTVSKGPPQRAHLDGALTLVRLRGLERFNDKAGLRALTRLLLSAFVTNISREEPVSDQLQEIRGYIANFVKDSQDPKWRLTGMILEVTDLFAEIKQGTVGTQERVEKCTTLDKKFEDLCFETTLRISYATRLISEGGGRPPDDFDDLYNERMVTQSWNMLRVVRILICEKILECYLTFEDESSQRAFAAIQKMVQEICGSIPQMTDCENQARRKLRPKTKTGANPSHKHTLSHILDTYILIFPLFVACWSRGCPKGARTWMTGQLDHIARHFGVKEAAAVAEILRQTEHSASVKVGPWEVYRLLGSYAFGA